jgi:plastocyanin
MKAAITVALSVLITAAGFAQQQNDRLQPSCGERKAKFEVHTANAGSEAHLEPGRSLVYIVEVAERAFLFDPRKITIRIGLDGEWVGAVKGTHTYMAVAVNPGEHHVCAERQSVQPSLEREAGFISFTAEPDKRYYFRARFAEHSGVKLDRINEDEGQVLISSSRLAIDSP